MEPKNPIIIDGVDISECCNFKNFEQEIDCALTYCGGCVGVDCNYKRYKREEYECQRIEQKLTLIRDFITDTKIRSNSPTVCNKILQIIDEVEE